MKVRITGPAYHNAIGETVPRTDQHSAPDLYRVRLIGYTDDDTDPVFVLVRASEVEVIDVRD